MGEGEAMNKLLILILVVLTAGCATLTNDPTTPIAISFSDGSSGNCELTNKRGAWSTEVPTTIPIRRSDDALKYQCETKDGRRAVGSIASEMGAKIVASAVFLDLGITDAITDMHREYAASFVIPIQPKEVGDEVSSDSSKEAASHNENRSGVYKELETLNDLRERGILTDAEFETEKKRILESR